MITAIVDVLNQVLLSVYAFTNSYGLSIIVLTLAIRLLTWPLMTKQLASAKAMQDLQPEIKKLQEKYKNDKEKLNAATMELWQKNKVNPMAGCLPLVIQMPILYAMFHLLKTTPDPEIVQSTMFLGVDMLKSLQAVIKAPFIEQVGYWTLVLLSGATTWFQQKLMTTDKSQQMMMVMMPLMLTYFSYSFQAGLVLYWVVNNLLSVGQHLLINRRPVKGAVSE